jgi:PAS domain S-box-containing protein
MVSPTSRYTLESLNSDGFLALRQDPGAPPDTEDFLCEYANPAAEALLAEPLLGRRLFTARPELALAGMAWGQVLSTGVAHTCILEVKRGPVTRQVRARAARVEQGLLAVWLSDVTESERFVRETADFEERMLAFVECMPDPFLALDGRQRFFYVNGAAERMLGKRRQALMGRSLSEEYPEGPGSRLRAQVRHVLTRGLPVDFEERLHTRAFQATAVPMDQGVLVYLRDATAHQQVTDSMRVLDALSAASMTSWDLRLPERRLHWEREAAAHFALDTIAAEEPLDAFLARVHIEDRPVVAQALSLEGLTSAGVSIVYRVRLVNGEQRRHALRARASPLGKGWRVLGVLEDVTGPRREDEARPLREHGLS